MNTCPSRPRRYASPPACPPLPRLGVRRPTSACACLDGRCRLAAVARSSREGRRTTPPTVRTPPRKKATSRSPRASRATTPPRPQFPQPQRRDLPSLHLPLDRESKPGPQPPIGQDGSVTRPRGSGSPPQADRHPRSPRVPPAPHQRGRPAVSAVAPPGTRLRAATTPPCGEGSRPVPRQRRVVPVTAAPAPTRPRFQHRPIERA